mmetsp:Transcript_48236/g.140590  ORF Transcript_48236/g.140590 Transcript_48236/m.140590 type:complete len:511 (+) Transcript_48236:94-1626(+)
MQQESDNGPHDQGLWQPSLPSPVPTPESTPLPHSRAPKTGEAGEPMLVMKFGGTSVANLECLLRVADIVRQRLDRRPVLVLSAMGKTTNELLAAADRALKDGDVDTAVLRKVTFAAFEELKLPVPASVKGLLDELQRILSGISLIKEISARTRDLVVSFGERLSIRVFCAVFNHVATKAGGDVNVPEARPIDSWEAGMLTSSGGGSANSAFSMCEVLPQTYRALHEFFAPFRTNYSYIPVVTGYVAKDPNGVITTLGRDGSDLTATVIGAAIQASEVQIWKDVSGVMTTDPRVVPAARNVMVLTFEEAAELSTFGAKVVHPAAILPAWQAGVPMSVLNSTAPEQPGTRIVTALKSSDFRDCAVAALSSKRDITMIIIRSTRMLGQHGFLAHVFQVFNKFQASVDVIATSEVTVSLTLDQGYKAVDLEGLKAELSQVAKVDIRENMGMVTLIAARQDSIHVLRQAFEIFDELKVKVDMISHGASNVNVTFVVENARVLECARALHARYFER